MYYPRVILFLLLFNTAASIEINGINLSHPKVLLKNKTLKVIMGHFPPSTIINRSDNGTTINYDGLLFHYLDWLSQYTGFKYDIIELEENVKGRYNKDEEEWTGMIAYLVNQTVDLALAKFGATIKRANGMDFAGFIDGDNTALLVDYPKAVVSKLGALEPFTLTVWIILLSGFVFVILPSWLIARIRTKYFVNNYENKYMLKTFSDVSFYFLSAFFNQGVFHGRGYQTMGIMAPLTWCFFTFVVVNSYTTTLTSFMSVKTRQPKINSFKDLARSEHFSILVGPGTISHIDMLNAKNGSLKVIGDRIRSCSRCLIDSWEEMADGVVGEFDGIDGKSYVGIGMTAPLHQLILNDFITKRYCRLTMAKEELNWKPMFLGLPVNSPYNVEINHATMWWHEFGLHAYWKQREGYPKQCLLDYGKKGRAVETIPSAITLNNLFVAFMTLFIGYLLSFLAFIYENRRKIIMALHCRRRV